MRSILSLANCLILFVTAVVTFPEAGAKSICPKKSKVAIALKEREGHKITYIRCSKSNGQLISDGEFEADRLLLKRTYTYDAQGRVRSVTIESGGKTRKLTKSYNEASKVAREDFEIDGRILSMLFRYTNTGEKKTPEIMLDGKSPTVEQVRPTATEADAVIKNLVSTPAASAVAVVPLEAASTNSAR